MEKRFFRYIPRILHGGAFLLLLSFLLCFAAAAGSDAAVDLQRTGSIRVVVKDADGKALPTGTLQLFGVAQLVETDGVQTDVLTDSFSGWDQDASRLVSDQSCADSLASYIKENNLTCMASSESRDGSVTFTDIAPGVYLVLQTQTVPGYDSVAPFLVRLPLWQEDRIVYDVVACPKPSAAAVQIRAEKVVSVKSGTAPKTTLFSFVLTREDNAPLPKNNDAVLSEDSNSLTVSRTGAGPVDFGTLPLRAADTGAVYRYRLREVRGSAAHYTYDTTVYHLTVRISEDGKSAATELTDDGGKQLERAVFHNLYDSSNSPLIPRTGQLWWPVMLMLPVGCILVLAGLLCRRRGNTRERAL